jgi:hypothetical protein
VKGSYGYAVVVLSCLFVGIGIALIVQTALLGGGVGYLLGVLFVALGVGRLYLRRTRGRRRG